MKKLALCFVVVPLALAACGGGSSSPQVNIDPAAYVKHAASKTADLKSQHMAMTAKMTVAGQTVPMSAEGDYQIDPQMSSITMTMSILGHDMAIDAVQDGSTFYMSSPLLTARLPSGKSWVKLDFAALGKRLGVDNSQLFSRTPAENLRLIEGAGTVTKVGSETIDGEATTEYRIGNLDISKLPQGKKLQSLARIKYGAIQVWIGDANGYVYRETMSFSYAGMGKTGAMTMQADFSKFNEPVSVTVPSASETVDMSSLMGTGMGG